MTNTHASSNPLEPLAVSLEDAARMIGIGRTNLYSLMRSGELPTFMIGKRRLVAVEAVRAFVASRAAMSESA